MPGTSRYIRFVALDLDPRSGRRTGVFSAIGQLLDEERLESWAEVAARKTLQWFNDHVPIPPVMGKDQHRRGICWFRPTARSALLRAWELVAILEEQGVRVQMITTHDPGRLCYEDSVQVVAVRVRSRPRRQRVRPGRRRPCRS